MKRFTSRLEMSLYRRVAQAVTEYDLIQEGDRILVAISGGKDSHALLHFLHMMKRRAPIRFELIAVHLDQRQPDYDGHALEAYLKETNYPHRILREDTYSIVKEKTEEGQAYCFMCSRLRRGILYRVAKEMRCTKIALGHHRDDALETLFLNLIFSAQLKSMPPKLISDDKQNTVIRPLIYCGADELQAYADEKQFPILPCNLCGSQPNQHRMHMRALLAQIEGRYPGASGRMMAALTRVRPTHLSDLSLWKALNLEGLTDTANAQPDATKNRGQAAETGIEEEVDQAKQHPPTVEKKEGTSEAASGEEEVSLEAGAKEFAPEAIPAVFFDAMGPLE